MLEAIAAAARPVSAAGVARTLDRPVNDIAYHMSELAWKGLIVVHSTTRARGGRETFYVLA